VWFGIPPEKVIANPPLSGMIVGVELEAQLLEICIYGTSTKRGWVDFWLQCKHYANREKALADVQESFETDLDGVSNA